MADPRDKLTPKQVAVLALLLAGKSIEGAAKEAKVGPTTIHRWLRDETFRAARDAGQRELADLAMTLGLAMVRSAWLVQAEHLTERTRAQLRQRASEFVIDHALQWIELRDIVARIEALEAKNAEKS